MKRILLTGASRGIGRATAEALLEAGHVVGLAARDTRALAELRAGRDGAHIIPVDLSDKTQVDALVPQAVAALGGLDALINCAGVVSYQPVGEVGRADLQAQLEVDFIAPFLLSQAAAMHMRKAGQGGCIVHVASTLGLRPEPLTAAYSAAKAALISSARALAKELGPDGIRVNAVAPGVTDTDMVRVPRPGDTGGDVVKQLEQLRQLHPLERLAEPEDVAATILYVLDATFLNGAVITVDGGLLLTV